MTPQARDLTIKHFSELALGTLLIRFLLTGPWPFPVNNVEVTVFLVSLKAGGVALNLVEVYHLYWHRSFSEHH